uniref:Uncharacterized protein n=1 Tax=Mycena chlorophos TaxID=658473 RepID=A0ABQ0L2E0_MYCCL|nr:predicted protein [Mycena chlorophos]
MLPAFVRRPCPVHCVCHGPPRQDEQGYTVVLAQLIGAGIGTAVSVDLERRAVQDVPSQLASLALSLKSTGVGVVMPDMASTGAMRRLLSGPSRTFLA